MHDLGKRIRQLRKWRGFSQSDLESKSGIKREYLSKLENNELKNPTYNTLIKISAALGIPLTSLIAALDEPLSQHDPVINVVSSGDPRVNSRNAKDNYLPVPIIREEIVATNPLYLRKNDIQDYAFVPYTWVGSKNTANRYRCLRITRGNTSMSPLLYPNSIVCFDTQQCDPYKLQQEMVVLRTRKGEAIVRKLNLENGHIVAIPEDLEKYRIHIFSTDRENPVIGKVIWYINVRG